MIPIKKWIGDSNDDSLLKLTRIMSNLRYSGDFRLSISCLNVDNDNPI